MDAFFSRFPRWVGSTLCVLFLALAGPVSRLHAADRPVTVQELCLMLRGGYTGDEVLRETAARPLLGTLDADGEKALRAAGADARLIASLKSAHRALTGDEAAAARQRQAEIDRRAEEARNNTQARLLDTRAPVAVASGAPGNSRHMADLLHGKLVTLRDGQVRPFDDTALAGKKYFALYFSALWCGPCRKFTPQFVEFYKQFAPAHPEFEVVFISNDHSPFDMENYMRQDGMSWPALAFDRKAHEPELLHYAGSGIPDLVIVDGSGKVISDSYHGEEYVGPHKVLADLGKLLTPSGTPTGL